ncbi:hypothetical protein JCM14076_22140 [Methylosoma difficile]
MMRWVFGLLVVVVLKFVELMLNDDAPNIGASLYQQSCQGQPLKTEQARQQALNDGYAINNQFDCIDKTSYAQVQEQKAVLPDKASDLNPAEEPIPQKIVTLAQARSQFSTQVAYQDPKRHPLPTPPSHLFAKYDYPSADGLQLPAFITPDPEDGNKHPAIIWLTGGDSNTLDYFWTPGPPNNDQSASAFRDAGIIMMFPSLRGGNTNPGAKEFFYGEVNDVLAAQEFLSALPYVDADHIYLGGHSTGGTLALLVAEYSNRFRAVFAFGPIDTINNYGSDILPVDLTANSSADEIKLRSPIYWLDGISSPVYLLEGAQAPSNTAAFGALCTHQTNPNITCLQSAKHNHFSILAPTTQRIAAQIFSSHEGFPFTLQQQDMEN